MRRTLVALLVVIMLAGIAIQERFRIIAWGIAILGPPALVTSKDLPVGAQWYDDYFAVRRLDDRTFAISEPRYWQQNYSYLIVGSERAVLFDAGPGIRDIRPVVASLTDRPITFIPSHFHYDHVGNEVTFPRVAVVDLPYLRARAQGGQLSLAFEEHLGVAEGIAAPSLQVGQWLAPHSTLELGNRSLRVLYTPGHTSESISLLDPEAGFVFSGDFIYPGPLLAFLPNSNLGDYLQSTSTVIESAPPGARIFGAHPAGSRHAGELPELSVSDVEELHRALLALRGGQLQGAGFYPVVYRVNDRTELWTDPVWFQNWTPGNLGGTEAGGGPP